MSPEIIGLLGLAALLVLILCRFWVGTALAIVGFIGIVLIRNFNVAFTILASEPYTQVNNYTITAIPLFTLMGMVIAETDIGPALYNFANKFIGRRKGGLASATIMASGLMGAITGSDNVSCVIMSKIALPEMKKFNYADSIATASVAAGAPLAIIIPPSMAFIAYGILTENSIGKIFIAGLLPGILLTIAYVIATTVACTLNPALGPRGATYSRQEKLRSLVGVLPTLILFLLVLGAIYAGIANATEAGALGATASLIIALVTKQLNWKKLYKIFMETVKTSAFVLFMLVGTFVFIRFVALSKLPFLITNTVLALNVSPFIILMVVAIMYIFMGMFLPQITMMVLTIPILYPAMVALGFDPLFFGVFVTMMMALGAITPPIGMDVFIVSGVSKVPVTTVFKGVWPYIIACAVVILLISIFPSIATFLPAIMS